MCFEGMAVFLKMILAALLLKNSALAHSETEGQTPAWTKEEMYRDMFPLDRSNFSDTVLRSREAWIVLFHQGTLERAWKVLAVGLRGIVWFGLVHTEEQTTLLKEIRYEKANGSKAIIYPHGPGKTVRWEATSDPETAKVMATDSLPDHTLDIRSVGVEDFVVDSLMAKPSRFPVLLLTEDEDVSSLWKALSYRLQRHFQFGRLVHPSLEEVRRFGLSRVPDQLPHLLVLTTTAPSGSSPDFRGVAFQTAIHGDLVYTSVFPFLYAINRDYRHLLYGNNMADRQEEVEMREVLNIENKRFDVQGATGLANGIAKADIELSVTGSDQKEGSSFVLDTDMDHDEL